MKQYKVIEMEGSLVVVNLEDASDHYPLQHELYKVGRVICEEEFYISQLPCLVDPSSLE